MKEFLLKFLSRKLLVTFLVMGATAGIPLLNRWAGVSDPITMMALGIIGGIAGAYQIANVKSKQDQGGSDGISNGDS